MKWLEIYAILRIIGIIWGVLVALVYIVLIILFSIDSRKWKRVSEEEKEQWLYEEYKYTGNFDFSRLDKYEEANDDLCIDDLILDYTMLYEEYLQQKEEIKRLKNINEEHRILNGELRKELQQKDNIIKEVREYIEENWISQKDTDNYRFDDAELIIEISDIAVLFDILDKGKE